MIVQGCVEVDFEKWFLAKIWLDNGYWSIFNSWIMSSFHLNANNATDVGTLLEISREGVKKGGSRAGGGIMENP